ncbi:MULTISPECIES: YtfJ family protein [Spongiibacter]|uniref:YtfJ family protein n=1 Tax=Spongiibacter TaxID=630749 RepID=UPI001B0A86EA|nr:MULTISPECIES: YtfJ family protein [Spongiibacter]MBO6751781.1 hypothetical protein [Spongiibacter sp.]|tara:strand:+ start:23372 stop:23917 length:546 start_codon:yes stop_codon:yes gene_type:complete
MRFIVMATLFLLSLSSYAASPTVGEPMPSLEIRDKGELHLNGKAIDYRPWATSSLNGDWALLQYMAARPKASKVNRHVVDAVSEKRAQGVAVNIFNIINVRDVPFGATGFALAELENNKRKYPDSPLIGDMDNGRQAWELKPGGSAIFLVDPKGTLRFFKDGIVSQQELDSLLTLLPATDQ